MKKAVFLPEKRMENTLLVAAVCRPVLTLCILFLLCSVLALLLPAALVVPAFLLLAVFALAFCFFSRSKELYRERLFAVLLLISVFLCLTAQGIQEVLVKRPQERFDALSEGGGVIRLTARVCEVRAGCTVARAVFADGKEQNAVFALREDGFVQGDILSFDAELIRTQKELYRYLERFVGYRCTLEAAPVSEISVTPAAEQNLLFSVRAHVSALLSSAKSSALLHSVLLADKTALPTELTQNLSALGASHLLALSGLHLSLLTGSLYALLRLLYVPRSLRCGIVFFLALFFVLLCGAPLSLLRAFLMLAVTMFASLLRLRNASVQSLMIAASVLVFSDLGALGDVGFLLSVSATLGILVFLPLTDAAFQESGLCLALSEEGAVFGVLRRVARGVWDTFCSSYAAVVFTLPVCAFSFGEAAVFSALFGILLIPYFSLLLNAAFLVLLFALCFGASVSAPLFGLCDALSFGFVRLTDALSAVAFSVPFENPASVLFAGGCLICFVLFCLYFRVRLRTCFFALPVFFCSAFLFQAFFSLFS